MVGMLITGISTNIKLNAHQSIVDESYDECTKSFYVERKILGMV